MRRLWDKGVPMNEAVLRFTVGDDHVLDDRLVEYDIRASIAHARMLSKQGYLTAAQFTALERALLEIGASHATGEWNVTLEEEDCHTAIENRLVEKLDDLGGRVHLGRSRNDQVLVALRLYLIDRVAEICGLAGQVAEALDSLAQRQGAKPLPGYTHMQRAMPSSVALWAGGFATEVRDSGQGVAASRRRLSVNPLGSAAGYGTPGLKLDREQTTEELGFDKVHDPVTAPQLSRGKAEADLAFQCTLLLQDLGRLAADLCLYNSQEFGFVRLPAAFTTGSSIMPQKRNPDVFELVRGHSGQAQGDLMAVLATTAKMTSGYHRDLQLIKAPLFRVLDRTEACCQVMVAALPAVEFDEEVCAMAVQGPIQATEEAYRLVVETGVSFREAYRTVAARLADEESRPT
ncbi:MAG: argininosuccinate lyase [Armatimonadetes bacterium]|nr:argininosuccinate lyase [Armatimonadota bacterium]